MSPPTCRTFPTRTPTIERSWTWAFDRNTPTTWLSSVLALNPSLHLAFTVQPSTTLPLATIRPVKVTVLDAQGNQATTFNGPVTITIGRNAGMLLPGKLSGTVTVNAVDGVAAFSDLSIDQIGNGYTLKARAESVTGAESASFNIGAL